MQETRKDTQPHAAALARCGKCGVEFACGALDPDGSCWCAGFPSVAPSADLGTSCLCRACLGAAAASGRPHGKQSIVAGMSDRSGAPGTFAGLLMHHVAERGDKPAMREKYLGIWQTATWRQAAAEVRAIADGLAASHGSPVDSGSSTSSCG